MPLSSGVEVLWPRTEAVRVADVMIEANHFLTLRVEFLVSVSLFVHPVGSGAM
jgi:hypothetical protein